MEYELAKELKEAGFPQGGEAHYFDATGTIIWSTQDQHVEEPLTYSPTLSELIEACGTPIYLRSFENKNWYCSNGMHSSTASGDGSTPEEAVARLWLALNQK